MPQVRGLGFRLGRCFCASHRGVPRTPAPCRLDHKKAVTEGLLLFCLRAKQALALGFEPDRRRWRIKGGRKGAAVKVSVPLQGTKKLWAPQGGGEAEDAARRAYNQAVKTDCIFCDMFNNGGVTDKFSPQYDTAEKIDENLTEFYVVAKDYSWTYIKTHECDLCGPYFLRNTE